MPPATGLVLLVGLSSLLVLVLWFFLKTRGPRKERFIVTVNRDRTIADGIEAGRYDYSHPAIVDENFPLKGSGTEVIEVRLVHFDRVMTAGQVDKALDDMDLRPADLQELLALAEQYPKKVQQFTIIAIGSGWQHPNGDLYILCTSYNFSTLDLDLRWVGSPFNASYLFAAVRK